MARVHLAGRKQQPRGYRNDLRAYRQLMLIVPTAGSLSVEHDGRAGVVGAGRFLVLPPGVDVVLSCPREGYRGFFVEGLPEDAAGLPRRVGIHRLGAAMGRMVDAIEAELDADEDEDLTPHWYALLLTHALRQHRGVGLGPPADDRALCQVVERRLRANLHAAGSLSSVLAGLPLGPRQVLRRWRRTRGETLKQAQLRLRLAAARVALTDPGRRITDIALELGFPSGQHFATMFRRATGRSPGDWRRTTMPESEKDLIADG